MLFMIEAHVTYISNKLLLKSEDEFLFCQEREVELQVQQQRQREAQRQAAEEARQKNSGLKWAARAQASPAPAQPVKSLLEIQAEEEKELRKVTFPSRMKKIR